MAWPIWKLWDSLGTWGKAAVVVGGAGLAALVAMPSTANANPLSGGGGGPEGSPIGDAHRSLVAGVVVRMPGSFHFRARPTVTPASTDRELEPQRVRIVASRADVRRGASETMYQVQLVDSTDETGYVFIPATALRAVG